MKPKSKAKQAWEKFGWFIVWFGLVACLGAILFPVFAEAEKGSRRSSSSHLREIALGMIMYAEDNNDRIPPMLNGPMRSVQDVRDGELTWFGEPRTDSWTFSLLDYTKSRALYWNPDFRYEGKRRFSYGPKPLAKGDKGYGEVGKTYRQYSLFPSYGLNYQFLAPIKGGDPLAEARFESRSLKSAAEPEATIFLAESQLDPKVPETGFFAVNAPGMWPFFASRSIYITFGSGKDCSGGWCRDTDATDFGEQQARGFVYGRPLGSPESGKQDFGTNYAFVDGHVKFMRDTLAAAGTTFVDVHSDEIYRAERIRGDVVIIDKSKYLWNLNDEFIDEAMAK